MGLGAVGNNAAAFRRMENFGGVEAANAVVAILQQAFAVRAGTESLRRIVDENRALFPANGVQAFHIAGQTIDVYGQHSGNIRFFLKTSVQQLRREAERIRFDIHKNGDAVQPEQGGKHRHIGIGHDRHFFPGQPGALDGQHEAHRAVIARQHM